MSEKGDVGENGEGRSPRLSLIKRAKRVVVKLGSGILTSPEGGINTLVIKDVARQVHQLQEAGREFIIVSSGAVVAGSAPLGLKNSSGNIMLKQAAAAVGQSRIIWAYHRSFIRYRQQVAQVLLTHDDLSNRRRYLNARNTLTTLLRHGVLPIINENDTVAVEEIKFGDNDALSAFAAVMIDADLLLILSDVDGLYTGDPNLYPSAQLIHLVEKITKEIEAMASSRLSPTGRGGMQSKLLAARRAANSGIPTIVANGKEKNIIARIMNGEKLGTLFLPMEGRMRNRKAWIAYNLKPLGSITIDDGARKALIENGKSLLPSGIVAIDGSFKFGDPVRCLDLRGNELARGLVNYGAEDLKRIKGCHTSRIVEILGYKYHDEVIHRDDLVLL